MSWLLFELKNTISQARQKDQGACWKFRMYPKQQFSDMWGKKTTFSLLPFYKNGISLIQREREGYSINEFCYHLIMLETGSPVKNLFTSGYTRKTKKVISSQSKNKTHARMCTDTLAHPHTHMHTHTHTHRETDALKQISSMEANVTCSSKETGSPVKNLFTSGYTRKTKRLYLHKAKTKHMHACAQTRSCTHTHTHTHAQRNWCLKADFQHGSKRHLQQ